MIRVIETEPKVYHLIETIHGWDRDSVMNWYYDLNKMLISEKPDFPDGMYTRQMSVVSYQRFIKYNLPRATGETI